LQPKQFSWHIPHSIAEDNVLAPVVARSQLGQKVDRKNVIEIVVPPPDFGLQSATAIMSLGALTGFSDRYVRGCDVEFSRPNQTGTGSGITSAAGNVVTVTGVR